MNPATAIAIAQGIAALIEIWRQHSNKPPEWIPTQADWEHLLALNEKTAQQYKDEAKAALDPIPADKPEM